jgi:hypothetical protein
VQYPNVGHKICMFNTKMRTIKKKIEGKKMIAINKNNNLKG